MDCNKAAADDDKHTAVTREDMSRSCLNSLPSCVSCVTSCSNSVMLDNSEAFSGFWRCRTCLDWLPRSGESSAVSRNPSSRPRTRPLQDCRPPLTLVRVQPSPRRAQRLQTALTGPLEHLHRGRIAAVVYNKTKHDQSAAPSLQHDTLV